jgi:shikimate dehydrogenase
MSHTEKLYGLIGYPLGHSWSQAYFTQKFTDFRLTGSRYANFEMQTLENIKFWVKNTVHLQGFNVTIPHKVSVIQYLDQLTQVAQQVGSVNTVRVVRNGNEILLRGHNTDVYGFEMSIKPFLKHNHHKALILGTGGASRAVQYVLQKLGVDVVLVSRNTGPGKTCMYNQLNKLLVQSYFLIVNTTPLGMFPHITSFPAIPYEYLTPDHFLIDLVYNPEETEFLKKGKQQGAMTLNGLPMLKLQAEEAWNFWNEE